MKEGRGGDQCDFCNWVQGASGQKNKKNKKTKHRSRIKLSFSDTTGHKRLIQVPPDPDAEKQNKRLTCPVLWKQTNWE